MTGIRIEPRLGQTVYLKDIKFSNSITVEHNSLGDEAIGHIVRNRRVAPDTAVFEDTWFHYDQVGSVLSESDKDGQLAAMHYQDAFGVRQTDWETGIPGGAREGWAHNTKELDPGTGLMYMYQRHYVPEYGMFMSRAPYEPSIEEEYVFAMQNPITASDAAGTISGIREYVPFYGAKDLIDWLLPGGITGVACATAAGLAWIKNFNSPLSHIEDKVRHCIISCEVAKQCGAESADFLGGAKELWDMIRGKSATYYDIHANRVGIGFAENCPDEDCSDLCWDAHEAGNLPNEPGWKGK